MIKKNIKFATTSQHIDLPKPSRNFIPEWYKKAERFVGGKPTINNDTLDGAKTIKTCVPFLDSLTNGYTIELWQDVEVIQTPGHPMFRWAVAPPVVELRDQRSIQGMPAPEGLSESPFAWQIPYYINVPKGYSLLITHPFNRFDLPFFTASGIVDADYTMGPGNIPFFMSKTFEGILPKGTPIAQLLPFKRNSWKSENNNGIIEKSEKQRWLSHSSINAWYKQNAWNNKKYE